VELARNLGDLQAEADYLNNLGVSARGRDDFERAEALYLRSLELQRRLGNRQREANSLHNLGEIKRLRFDLAAAERYHLEAMGVFRELGDHTGIGRSSLALAEIHLLTGRVEQAGEHIEAAEAWQPDDLQVRSLRALEAYQRGQLRAAVELQSAAVADPGPEPPPQSLVDRLEVFREALRSGVRQPLPEEQAPGQ
jgi:tetratricopeptide (TPR) repeat protein